MKLTPIRLAIAGVRGAFLHSSATLPFAVLMSVCSGTVAQTYTTVATGNWSSASVWEGGNVPSASNLTGTVIINHDVTLTSGGMTILSSGSVTVTSAHLAVNSGNVMIYQGTLRVTGGSLTLGNGNLQLNSSTSKVYLINSEIDIGQDVQNTNGLVVLRNVCGSVQGQNFQNSQGIDTLDHVQLTLGGAGSGNFQNNASSTMYITQSRLRVIGGNFENSGTISGDIAALWVPGGNLSNNGTWTAMVSMYCIGGSISIPPAYRPASEDCAGISTAFSDCGTFLPVELISFTAKVQSRSVLLEWSTAHEVNSDFYTIERSSASSLWMEVGHIRSTNSATTITYSLVDEEPISGTVYYRLKETSLDGTTSFSDIRKVEADVSVDQAAIHGPVSVYDASGRLVFHEELTGTIHSLDEVVRYASLPAGMYIMRINSGASAKAERFCVR